MNKKIFLKRAKLNGFKTIKNVDVQFNDGLNIIIGKNAIGKTNLLHFLHDLLRFKYDISPRFTAVLDFSGSDSFRISTESSLALKTFKNEDVKPGFFVKKFHGELFHKKDKVLSFDPNNINELKDCLFKREIQIKSVYLKHGIPENYFLVDKPLNFSFGTEGGNSVSTELFNIYENESTPRFVKYLVTNLLINTLDLKWRSNEDVNDSFYKEKFTNLFSSLSDFSDVLLDFSPIKQVRLNNNFNISKIKDEYSVSNVYLEFLVDDNWFTFENLSDGTKRVFYIMSELYDLRKESTNSIFLLEEPELGIHPHQFFNLLNYIKECSKRAQIILTTHSPQALNILSESELDRIILGSNRSNTSIFNHMNDVQKEKAKAYMSEDYLSDYWLYSDLDS
ncbi:ATP-dependent nuclease [Myroides sp. LJL115]